jgi:hypothetical protein
MFQCLAFVAEIYSARKKPNHGGQKMEIVCVQFTMYLLLKGQAQMSMLLRPQRKRYILIYISRSYSIASIISMGTFFKRLFDVRLITH